MEIANKYCVFSTLAVVADREVKRVGQVSDKEAIKSCLSTQQ